MANSKRLTMSSKAQRSEPITIGLDIGYGVTKAVTDQNVVTFPSVAGYAHHIRFRADQLSQLYPGEQITDEDGDWFVGNLALSQLKAHEQLRLRGRTVDEAALGNIFRKRLARVAIGKLLPNEQEVVHIRLATGLPVDHMPDAVALKEALIGQHLIQTDQAHFVANIVEVMCMPQPYGTIYRQMLLPSGQLNACHVATRTGVVDIGTYTIDLTLDDNGEYIQARSGSIEAGVYTAQQRIANVIEDKYREKPDYRMVEQVLRTGCLMVRGESENYSEEVAAALDPLRDATLNLMNEKWSTGVNVDAIYLSGGGAEYVHKAIKVHYPQTQKVDDAQLANARGYLHYANFVALDA